MPGEKPFQIFESRMAGQGLEPPRHPALLDDLWINYRTKKKSAGEQGDAGAMAPGQLFITGEQD